jgi:hypothetical protein
MRRTSNEETALVTQSIGTFGRVLSESADQCERPHDPRFTP